MTTIDISESDVERFERDGAVALRGLLDPSWIDALRHAVPELLDGKYDPISRMQRDAPVGEGSVQQTHGKWCESATFRRFLFESPIAAASAALMRSSSATLFEDLFQLRDPGPGLPGWHRDQPFWPVSGYQATNVWFTLEAVTPYAGGIHVVTGSHLDRGDDLRASAPPGPSTQISAFGCEPGDVIIFHPWALHSGYGSSPDQPRRTFTIRFLGDDIRWRPTRTYYHAWMGETHLQEGDKLEHEGFPTVWSANATVGA